MHPNWGASSEWTLSRVAYLAVAIGDVLGVTGSELEDLETAAWLHHLGSVSLDEPADGMQLDPPAVAEAGAEILRSNHHLAGAGDVAAQSRDSPASSR